MYWLLITSGLLFMFVPPISQDLKYHLFADTRCLCQIPNYADVLSNLPFIFIGILGLFLSTRLTMTVFYAGVFLTGFGSTWYHWRPNNQTLVWDRLPMTVAFMSLFADTLGYRSPWILLLFVIAGAGSVIYWSVTEYYGRGDLRAYMLVQYYPIFYLARQLTTLGWPLMLSLALYLLAKLLEINDRRVFGLTNEVVSGHTLKHLVAELAALVLIVH